LPPPPAHRPAHVGDVLAGAAHREYGAPVVAVDGPTGLDLSSGEAPRGRLRCGADRDIRRRAPRASISSGSLRADHRWPTSVFHRPDPSWALLITDDWAKERLPKLQPTMHKGDRGRVTVVGGAPGMTGAALHAARGRVGGGRGARELVASAETIEAARASLPDVLTVVSALGPALEPEVAEALEWADALVVGPGLGREPARAHFLAAAMQRRAIPTVVDADALTLWNGLAERPLVFTPHLGNFGRWWVITWPMKPRTTRWAAAAKGRAESARRGAAQGRADGDRRRARAVRVWAAGNPVWQRAARATWLADSSAPFSPRTVPSRRWRLARTRSVGAADWGQRQWTARSLRRRTCWRPLPRIRGARGRM